MFKTILAGVLLFSIMVFTAIVVMRPAPSVDGAGAYNATFTQQQQPVSDIQSQPVVVHSGEEDGGIEDNPFVIMAGIALILFFAVGFWKYHHILEQRQAEEQPAKKKLRPRERIHR